MTCRVMAKGTAYAARAPRGDAGGTVTFVWVSRRESDAQEKMRDAGRRVCELGGGSAGVSR